PLIFYSKPVGYPLDLRSFPTRRSSDLYEIDALGTGAGESCTHRSARDGVGGGGRASRDAGARKDRLIADRKAGGTGDHPRRQGLSENLQGGSDSCRAGEGRKASRGR